MSTQHTLNSNRPRFTAVAAIPCATALGYVVRKNITQKSFPEPIKSEPIKSVIAVVLEQYASQLKLFE